MLKIKNYTPTNDPQSSTVGYVSFYVTDWGLHLNGCRYIRKRNGGFFVAYPSRKIEKDGQDPEYMPYFTFDKDRNDRFQSAAQKAINEWIQNNGN